MYSNRLLTLCVLTGLILSVSCTIRPGSPTDEPGEAGLPNPASVYCEEQGGEVDIRTAMDGSQVGLCVFTDGSQCEEWAYFRGDCLPAYETGMDTDEDDSSGAAVVEEGWTTFRNDSLGYSFAYPAEAEIIPFDNPRFGEFIQGPQVDSEVWPSIEFSHPLDQEGYQPPVDVDLEQWLSEHNLLAEVRQRDIEIAGTTAIHTRHERSPQSYAFDRYFFAVEGQLYVITIGHSGDKEDWRLYNRFLASIRFGE